MAEGGPDRTRELPPYIHLVFKSTGPYCGNEAVRQSLLQERSDTPNQEPNYRYTTAKWDALNQRFPPVGLGRIRQKMEIQLANSPHNFLMNDSAVSKVQADFQLHQVHGEAYEIHFRNLGRWDLHHFRGNESTELVPNGPSVALANGDFLDFYTSGRPLRMRCDLKTESEEDPRKTGFTVAVEEESKPCAAGVEGDMLDRVPIQPTD